MSTTNIATRALRYIATHKAPIPFSQVPILAVGRDENGIRSYDLFVVRLESGEFLFIAALDVDENCRLDDFLPDTYLLGFSVVDGSMKMQVFETGNETEPVCTRGLSSLVIHSEVGPDTAQSHVETGESLPILVADISSKDPFLLVWQKSTGCLHVIQIPEAIMRTIHCDRGKDGVDKNPGAYDVVIVKEGGFTTLDISKRKN
ncbi:MAG: hypothetical protein HGB18_04980 [Candidatus Moranbacteria bacterium]|nr:hypothetical protein [Candidatus Moranbacteria bacterium]